MIVRLADARDPTVFGGKAAALARGRAAGLPIPDGIAVAAGGEPGADDLVAALAPFAAPFAVRSSVVGEDGEQHSFAGIYLTRLGVAPGEIDDAIREVRRSVHSPSAVAYRARRGIASDPRIGIVIQPLVAVDVAAVVFTRSPVSGHDEILIEASLGLGESVAAGAIVPDRFVLDRTGRLIEQSAGDKDTAQVVRSGRVVAVEVDSPARTAPCLSRGQLDAIVELVALVDRVWPAPHDLEIGFAAGRLYLFQRRRPTR